MPSDANGQSFSIRYFAPTNGFNHPITGFNNRTEMVGVLGDGFISGGDLIDAAWVWLLESKRWSGGNLQFIAGFAKPKEPAIGDIWPHFA